MGKYTAEEVDALASSISMWGDDYSQAVKEILRDYAAHLRERESAKAGVPDGWQLVPVEPTRGMLDAATNYDSDMIGLYALEFWQAMLAAAPKRGEE